MPTPTKGEKQSHYVGRCMSDVMGEGGSNQKQAAGKCYGMYRSAIKKRLRGSK